MENQKPETKSDEIDLSQLFSRIGDFFAGAWLRFMYFLAKIRSIPFENKLSFTLIIVASVGIGVSFTYFVSKSFYESKMIFSSDYLNKRLAESTVDKLDVLARERTKEGLARTLGLADTLADNIIGFEVRPFVDEKDVVELEVLKEQLRAARADATNIEVIDKVIERIEMENRHAFEITVRTLNPSVIPNLQEAIVGYFRRNPYIRKRVEINNENLAAKKKKLERDIAKLDSLKFAIYDNFMTRGGDARTSSTVVLGEKAGTNPVDIYNQDLRTYDAYQETSEDLYLQKDFEVVDGFTEFSEPASAGMGTMIFYSLVIGVAIAYLDVALRSFNKYLANLK